ncbi:unnamed protein product [Closterium sp. NIES-54]
MIKVHGKLGHYGIARTRQLLSTMYWWASMRKDVAAMVATCEACQRNKAALERERDELQSLPIRGLGYRWSLDLAGELPLSTKGKQYILSDGLTERMIQTLKKGLRAYGENNKRNWDKELPWILARYRFANQSALKNLSPYHLLYGRDPVLPVDAPKLLSVAVEADEPGLWAEVAQKRARYLRELTPAALDNLHVAQLRDARRYQQRKEEGKGKQREDIAAGQEVYLRKAKRDTLDLAVGPERWKVKEVRESGVLVLEDQRGKKVKEHVTNVARAKGVQIQAEDPVTRAAGAAAQAREGAGSPDTRGAVPTPENCTGPYPELVGSLMYAMMCIRPDLAYPVSGYVALGRFTDLHWKAESGCCANCREPSLMSSPLVGFLLLDWKGTQTPPGLMDQTDRHSSQG